MDKDSEQTKKFWFDWSNWTKQMKKKKYWYFKDSKKGNFIYFFSHNIFFSLNPIQSKSNWFSEKNNKIFNLASSSLSLSFCCCLSSMVTIMKNGFKKMICKIIWQTWTSIFFVICLVPCLVLYLMFLCCWPIDSSILNLKYEKNSFSS